LATIRFNSFKFALETTTGRTLGGGIEWMFFPQRSVKAEYLNGKSLHARKQFAA
jgi:hypothetical protein